ncbi:MAG: ethanolamine utilization protein EutH [Clostridia bacterium]|nr:ethanolamine utilization protein EutH [Clostridia bacterium]
MSFLAPVIIVFAVLGAVDYVIGNKFGIGEEFKKAFMLLGAMALSMIGMIVIAPLIGDALSPVFEFTYNILHIEPSIIPASLFANDMGGAPLAKEIAKNPSVGMFNALVVSSMMGATISFTIPFAIGVVGKDRHNEMFLGFLCGIVTVPIGCFVSGLICGIHIISLLLDLVPLLIFSVIIAFGLIKAPNLCVKIFKIFAKFMTVLIMIGLLMGIVNFLMGRELIKGIASIEEGAMVCFNASIVMCGMFPLLSIISRLLKKPLKFLGTRADINEVSAIGFISTLATNATTLGMMDKMDKKGVMLNSAFAVSAAFTFAGHLAFTMAFEPSYLLPVIIGKIVAGIFAVIVAGIIYKFTRGNKKCSEEKK